MSYIPAVGFVAVPIRCPLCRSINAQSQLHNVDFFQPEILPCEGYARQRFSPLFLLLNLFLSYLGAILKTEVLEFVELFIVSDGLTYVSDGLTYVSDASDIRLRRSDIRLRRSDIRLRRSDIRLRRVLDAS